MSINNNNNMNNIKWKINREMINTNKRRRSSLIRADPLLFNDNNNSFTKQTALEG